MIAMHSGETKRAKSPSGIIFPPLKSVYFEQIVFLLISPSISLVLNYS